MIEFGHIQLAIAFAEIAVSFGFKTWLSVSGETAISGELKLWLEALSPTFILDMDSAWTFFDWPHKFLLYYYLYFIIFLIPFFFFFHFSFCFYFF